MVGLEGFEPPTHGLGNPCPTVHPVRIHNLSVGYSNPHSDPRPPFGHEYAPHNAPRIQTAPPKSNGFSSVADCLHLDAHRISISKRRLKHLDSIHLVRQQRENHQQQIAFHTWPFVLCGLPLRRPPADQLVYTRRNGLLVLEITAHPLADKAKLWKELRPTHLRRAATQPERIVGLISAKNSAAQIVESCCAEREIFDLWSHNPRVDETKATEFAK